MKKIFQISLAALTALLITSCVTTYPYTASNNPIGSKKGTSESIILFGQAGYRNLGVGLVLNSDYGVLEAVEKAGIKNVGVIDLKVKDYIFFQKATIIVYGD